MAHIFFDDLPVQDDYLTNSTLLNEQWLWLGYTLASNHNDFYSWKVYKRIGTAQPHNCGYKFQLGDVSHETSMSHSCICRVCIHIIQYKYIIYASHTCDSLWIKYLYHKTKKHIPSLLPVFPTTKVWVCLKIRYLVTSLSYVFLCKWSFPTDRANLAHIYIYICLSYVYPHVYPLVN